MNSRYLQKTAAAGKSLSALKSRKEEIIDSLQVILGEAETKKISDWTYQAATNLQKMGGIPGGQDQPDIGANVQEGAANTSTYNPWTSRYNCSHRAGQTLFCGKNV